MQQEKELKLRRGIFDVQRCEGRDVNSHRRASKLCLLTISVDSALLRVVKHLLPFFLSPLFLCFFLLLLVMELIYSSHLVLSRELRIPIRLKHTMFTING